MKKLKLFVLMFSLFTVILAGCSIETSSESKEKKTILVATSPGPYSELFLKAIKPILEEKGYTIKDKQFSELLQADVALSEGEVDLNVDQHSAYMNNFNENKNAKLVSLTPIPTVLAGIFPGRKASLDNVKKGDVIGIPNDPSNAARGYALLQKAKLIKLKDGIELVKATAEDVVQNPYNLKIVEMDSATIPRSLTDLDYGVIPGSIVYASKLDAKTSLLSEDILKKFELVAVVNVTNKDTNWAKAVINAYQSKEFKQYMEKHNKDSYWFIPDELK
ncbi:MetQ/NlpA family ABC transporter substrate-binding protein [Bacillus massiliigorillae]|uniref:MetQ/NlpA family ABC transporter substrate-binding protein n=1 Tax=Bacillus massiliigorillae TaxID=1243664 RepID=UPI00039B059C|nr:MetQ/NlpA family ABC transporter substrate-binding protein [Bacillus massiliigorillae]